MNFPIPLFALLAARQAHDSPADTGRIVLMSMMIQPRILGLLLAVAMARHAAPAQAVLAGASSAKTSQGALVFKQVAPETDLHSFLPSFVGFTKKQALEFAKELRLHVDFVEAPSGPSKNVVGQDPAPGGDWPPDREVTLQLGII